MDGSELKKYAKYSLKFILLSVIFSAIYYFYGEKNFFSNVIYIVFMVIIAQVNYFVSAYRGDVYIKNNYKCLYNIYHIDSLLTPDNIMLQILLKINFMRSSLSEEAIEAKDSFREDANYSAIKSDICIAMIYSLFVIIYSFIYLIVTFIYA